MVQGCVMPSAFGKKLKELRQAAGLSQEALARAADVSTSAVVKMEAGNANPTLTSLRALARHLSP